MKKVALIDKAPSRVNYSEHIGFEFDHFHMSDVPIKKLLKKDVTLVFDPEPYDLVILVGSEAAKNYAKVTSVTTMAGTLVNDKFVCIGNPAALIFKPDGKPEFERAIHRINKIYNGTNSNAQTGDFDGISSTEEIKEYLRDVLQNASDHVEWDTETTALYPRDGYVLGVSLTYKQHQGRYMLCSSMDDECLMLLQEIADKFIAVFHNMKFDIKMIQYHLDVVFDPERVEDTMLMHYVLDENAGHGLKDLALKYTEYGDYDSELDSFKKEYCRVNKILQEEFTYDLIPYDIMKVYASIDTAVTRELYWTFLPLIEKNAKLLHVYRNLLIKGTIFLMSMEEVGIPFSKDRLVLADTYLSDSIEAAIKEVYEFYEVEEFEKLQGKEFNPNSVIQLRKLLFDHIGLSPTGKKTSTGAVSTDASVLEELSEVHPLPKAILKVRQLTKLRNTYISKLIPSMDMDDRVRTNFNLIFTTSGRLSSSGKFNAQQIPRDDPIIKGCIVAPEGYSIVSQDLQTGESYIAAVLSGDIELQRIFKTGGDMHSNIAKAVFGLNCSAEDVKRLYPELRQAAKAITFGILYGSGAASVAETVSAATGKHYPVSQAEEDIKEYFTKFSQLKKWLNARKEFIKANGFTYSAFGRKRRLPNVFSSDKAIVGHEIRSGINSEIQSVCSDVNLLGAMETQEECNVKKLDAKIFMLVHDSIVALVKNEVVKEFCEIMERNTRKDRGCSIPGTPIGVDTDIGNDYSFGKFEEVYEVRGHKLARVPDRGKTTGS